MQFSRSRFACVIAVVLVAILTVYQPQLSAHDQGKLVKLADNVYSYAGAKEIIPQNSFGSNSGVIIGDDGIVVIDSRVSAIEARQFIKDIRAISDKPIKYVINTHSHLDHSFGNCEFAKLGATIISSTIDKENMQRVPIDIAYMTFGVPKEVSADTTLAYPNLTFSDKLEIDLGNQKVVLIYPGPSHTAGSILVYLPDKKILFTGDALVTGSVPFVGDGNIPKWLGVLDVINGMDVEKIVPGHGPLSGKQDVADMKSYLSLFDQKATELCSKSKDLSAIAAEMKRILPPRDGEMLIEANIAIKYLKK